MSTRTARKVKKNAKAIREISIRRPARAVLTAEESLKRMNDFEKRKDKFIAAIRKSKD